MARLSVMMRISRILLMAAFALLSVNVVWAQGAIVDVIIPGFSFSPSDLTVEIGTTVRWINNHEVLHTSTSDDGIWDSGDLSSGMEYSYTFLATGIYPYHCSYHALSMTGTVTVVNTGDAMDISIPGFAFNPDDITIEAGTVVRWTNNHAIVHTTTSSAGFWDSGNLSQDQQFSYLFLTPGDYPYLCTIHPSMVGNVTVIDPPSCICGDADNDGDINILDIVFLINFKYKNGPGPIFPACANVNNDGDINILDIVYLINYKYKSGPEPICG